LSSVSFLSLTAYATLLHLLCGQYTSNVLCVKPCGVDCGLSAGGYVADRERSAGASGAGLGAVTV